MGKNLLKTLPEDRRPKLVVLHTESAKLVEAVRGESVGIFTKLTQKEWGNPAAT